MKDVKHMHIITVWRPDLWGEGRSL